MLRPIVAAVHLVHVTTKVIAALSRQRAPSIRVVRASTGAQTMVQGVPEYSALATMQLAVL